MTQIVAFLDILGTSSRVQAEQFGDGEILDFINPVCVLASRVPSLRCAAFSDSVVASAAEDDLGNLLKGLHYLFSSWTSDCILVRGGIGVGEVSWVDMDTMDVGWRRLTNLAFARIYGKGLLEAQETERGSGPGAVCFISARASELIRAFNANLVLRGPVDVLVWASHRRNEWIQRLYSASAQNKDHNSAVGRQINATLWYHREMERLSLFTPPEMMLFPEREEGSSEDCASM